MPQFERSGYASYAGSLNERISYFVVISNLHLCNWVPLHSSNQIKTIEHHEDVSPSSSLTCLPHPSTPTKTPQQPSLPQPSGLHGCKVFNYKFPDACLCQTSPFNQALKQPLCFEYFVTGTWKKLRGQDSIGTNSTAFPSEDVLDEGDSIEKWQMITLPWLNVFFAKKMAQCNIEIIKSKMSMKLNLNIYIYKIIHACIPHNKDIEWWCK